MKKRTLACVLAGMIASTLVFGACGSSNSSNAVDNSASSSKGNATSGSSSDSSASSGTVDYSSMTIAWSTANLTNELQVLLTDHLEAEIEALGASFVMADPSSDATTQVEQVENFIAQGVDFIMMSPVDASASGVVVGEAKDAGIPLMIVNCMLDDMDKALCYVGCNDLSAGEMIMEYVAEEIGGEGTIAILRGPDGLDAQIKRTEGINNVLADYPGIEVYDSQCADWETATAMSITEDWLQVEELDAIVCENDEMAIGAVEAVLGEGVDISSVCIAGIDGVDSAIISIAAGEMRVTLLQDAEQIAKKSVEVMCQYFEEGADSIDDEYIIDWTVIDSDNVADYE